MSPIVSIIMGSTSDLPVLEKAAQFFDEMEIPFEMNALSAHRTPQEVETFARGAEGRGIKVIIAAAGMAAALPGVIAANTTIPVIGVPVKGMLDGLDAIQAAALAGLMIDLSENCAIIFSSHSLESLHSVCSRALILNAGRLIADGTPDGLTAAQPGAKTFTQAFVRMAAAPTDPLQPVGSTARDRREP